MKDHANCTSEDCKRGEKSIWERQAFIDSKPALE